MAACVFGTRRRFGFAIAAILAAVSMGPATGSPAAATTTTTASVAVNPANAGYAVPQRFIGFSVEPGNVCNLVQLAQSKPALKQLLANLGRGNLRIGGNTLEYTSWQPDASAQCKWDKTVYTKALVDGLFNFVNSVGWNVTWTTPLKHFDPSQGVPEALYVASKGAAVSSVEFGNEPNKYGTTYSSYLQNWRTYYNDFRASNTSTPVSGPATAGLSTPYLSSFMNDAATNVNAMTGHFYMGVSGGTNPPTVTTLLSASTVGKERTGLKSALQVSNSHSKPLVVNETGSYYQQGQPGVSDVYASALWGADYAFNALDLGVHGLNFHGVPDNPTGNSRGLLEYYSPIYDDATPAPMYYGLLLYHYATRNGGRQVPASVSSAANITAHAVRTSSGQLNVVLINKTPDTAVTTTVNTTASFTKATYVTLQASSLSAKTGITLGGTAVQAGGSWAPSSTHSLAVSGAKSTVSVPAGSALVITYG